MASDREVRGSDPRDRLRRELTLLDTTFLVVACVIGAGIFFTPGRVAELLPHPHWILAAWIFGALLSLAGALANAELGAMFPHAGGDYVYLREGVHPVAGFLVGWLTFFAIQAGTIAALSAAAGEMIAGGLGLDPSTSLPIAVALTLMVSGINMLGVRWAALANNLTTAFKILALLAFIVFGPLSGNGDVSRLGSVAAGVGSFSWMAFGVAMSPVLFSYLGWNSSIYVASEIRNPGRTLPLSLFAGLGICAGIYLLVNAVYLYALPMESLMGVVDAGRSSAVALFGTQGGRLVGAFVLVSVLGTLNATALLGPRIAYAMALDGLFFGPTQQVSSGSAAPNVAIAAQAVVTVGLLLVLRSFPNALDFTTFAILLATMADVIALFRLRRLQPDRERPYRAWGYPVIPGIYLVVCAAITLSLVWGRPRECAISFAMLLAGLPFYWAFARDAGTRAD